MREAAEEAEAELVLLRGRLKEWEEEESRAAELKGTLETTRDALDELRCVCVSCGEEREWLTAWFSSKETASARDWEDVKTRETESERLGGRTDLSLIHI